MKKRIFSALCAGAMLCSLLSACGGSAQGVNGVVNVYNWGEYIDTDLFNEFTAQTGIKVNYSTYESNESMYTKLRSGSVNYDVIIPSDYMISRLIDENMLQKQNIEYQMLRAKINPHFLSNIFNLIVQLAEGKEYEKIVLAAQQTANFYRKNLARNKDSVKLMEEMNAILAYLDIIGLMKPGAVTCHYEVDAKTERCIIPSFLLQPIVENAVNHAMVNGKITLCISAKAEQGNLTIKIRDNGIGMSREQMENLFKIRGSHGYGLYSIRERIRLKYPDAQYGVFASCEEGCGTEISIVIPEINEFEQEEADV